MSISRSAPSTPTVGAWVAMTPLSGTWVNHAGGYQTPRYRLVGDVVELEGYIKSGTTGTTVFTLPAGFRPPATVRFPADATGAYGQIEVTSAGVLTLTGTTTGPCSIAARFSTVA